MGLAWGGFLNGRIPLSQLHEAPSFAPLESQYASASNGSNLMRTDAAMQLSGMMAAFYAQFDTCLLLSEGYRPVVPIQDWYYNRYMNKLPGWTLAAFPGTSIHGWGLSADLNIHGSNPSGEHLDWLRANAHLWGFVNDVASEPWHWSYRTDLVTRSIVVAAFIPDQTVGHINQTNSTKTPIGDIMDVEILHVDASTRTKKKGDYDSFLVNINDMRCMHIASATQETFLLNKGVPFKTKDVQARQVLDGFELVKGKGARV